MKLISKNQYGNSINRIDAIKDSTPKILPSKYKYLGKGNESNNYNTQIPINKVTLYNKWFNSLPSDIRNTDNYDMQGYWLNMVDGRNESREEGEHFPDTYKKPNHPTFSNQSQYKNNKAGSWIVKNNNYVGFNMSPWQMNNSDETLHALGYDSNVKPVYNNGIVLPTVYVTPKHNYINMKSNKDKSGWIYKDTNQ